MLLAVRWLLMCCLLLVGVKFVVCGVVVCLVCVVCRCVLLAVRCLLSVCCSLCVVRCLVFFWFEGSLLFVACCSVLVAC